MKLIDFITEEEKKFIKGFKDEAKKAGLLPYYEDESGKLWFCLMIPSDPSYGGTHPQIAKGNIDAGESAMETAIREGKEELGLPWKPHYKAIFATMNYPINNIKFYYVKADSKKLYKHDYETGEVLWLKEEFVPKRIRDWQEPIFNNILRKIKSQKS